jgi:hypothetical protein
MTTDQRVYRWPNCNGYDTTIYKLALHLYSSQATTFVQLQEKNVAKVWSHKREFGKNTLQEQLCQAQNDDDDIKLNTNAGKQNGQQDLYKGRFCSHRKLLKSKSKH